MMEKAQPQFWRKYAISRDPEDIEDPENAPYLYTAPDGTKFIDWYNPNKSLEKWGEKYAERIKLFASGDQERIDACYAREHINQIVKKYGLGPDRHDGEIQEPVTEGQPSVKEMMTVMRLLRLEVEKLNHQKYLLALHAARSGCPETGDPDCPLRTLKPEERNGSGCAVCWAKYADTAIMTTYGRDMFIDESVAGKSA